MNELNISLLALQISNLHEYIQKRVLQQVNNALSIRNWLIGLYILEYEQNGNDTAVYGLKVMKELADRLKSIKGMSSTQLYLYKDFYKTYPEFFPTVSGFLQNSGFQHDGIFLTLSGKLENEISKQQKAEHSLPAEMLLSRLSFSHFIELIKAETPLKRAFYEVESVKNNWSVRDLNRAMSTLLFERSGLSTNKEAVIAKAKNEIATLPSDIIKNPYFLEFLGLEEKPEYSESNLEQAIIDHLQKFLVELGRGFCFEARQKRITFDNKHYRIDLVFYNRILKCHVLLDLKVGEFDHADAGQMNMYLNYYRKNEMTEGDNPPVGIILCANKNDALVEYATSGLAQDVFVSKYMVQLPSVEELKMLLAADRDNLIAEDDEK